MHKGYTSLTWLSPEYHDAMLSAHPTISMISSSHIPVRSKHMPLLCKMIQDYVLGSCCSVA